LDLLARSQTAPLPFTESEVEEASGGRDRVGFRVRFGTVPDYTWDGDGLLLSGTSPGSPAERAGMLPGDLLYEVGGMEIITIHDFVHFLRIHKPGDVILARFERGGEEMETTVTLESRELE
jgi:S1-C subfamily serine protease